MVQARSVVAGAEGPHGAVLALVGLDAFEDGLAVVEDGGAGGQLKRTVGDDAAVTPSALASPAHVGHVIRELLAKSQSRHDLAVLFRRRRVRVGSQGKTASQLIGGGQDQVASSLKFRGGVLRRCHEASCRGFFTKMKPEYARRPHCGRLISECDPLPHPLWRFSPWGRLTRHASTCAGRGQCAPLRRPHRRACAEC